MSCTVTIQRPPTTGASSWLRPKTIAFRSSSARRLAKIHRLMFPGVPLEGDTFASIQRIRAPGGMSDSGKKRRASSFRTTVIERCSVERHSAFTRLMP